MPHSGQGPNTAYDRQKEPLPVTGTKDKVARIQKQSVHSTYWRHSLKHQALGEERTQYRRHYRTSSSEGHYPQEQET